MNMKKFNVFMSETVTSLVSKVNDYLSTNELDIGYCDFQFEVSSIRERPMYYCVVICRD